MRAYDGPVRIVTGLDVVRLESLRGVNVHAWIKRSLGTKFELA